MGSDTGLSRNLFKHDLNPAGMKGSVWPSQRHEKDIPGFRARAPVSLKKFKRPPGKNRPVIAVILGVPQMNLHGTHVYVTWRQPADFANPKAR